MVLYWHCSRSRQLVNLKSLEKMHIVIVLTFTSFVINFVSTETTKEPITNKNVQIITSPKQNLNGDAVTSNPQLDSVWAYRPATKHTLKSLHLVDKNVSGMDTIQAQPLTRLAKTLSFDFEPFFDKVSFQPFESRPKPVTLVAFRKNSILPVSKVKISDSKSGEVAELQSPYNYISSFS